MKVLPVLYQKWNKLELCAFSNTLWLLSHKHFSICSSLQNSSSDLTGLQGKFKFKDILICRLKTYGMIFSYLCIRLYCHLRSCMVSLLASSCCSRMVQVYATSHVIYQPRCLWCPRASTVTAVLAQLWSHWNEDFRTTWIDAIEGENSFC